MRGRIVNQMLKTLILATGLVTFVGCSGQQQEDDSLEATDDNNANLGQDDAAEGNGQENFVDNGDGEATNNQAQGADVNSTTADGSQTEQLDSTLTDSGAQAAPMNNAMAANPAPTNNAPAPVAAPAGEGSPVAGGRVRYVRTGGVQAVNAPGGQPVMMIEQGEHPVTWEENGYLKIANGVYVPVDSLSDKGIARPTMAGGWAH